MKFNFKLSMRLIVAFMLFTVIGTLTHELGHIVVSKYLGYDSYLHYGSSHYEYKGYSEDTLVKALNEIYQDNIPAITNNEEFIDKKRFEELRDIVNQKYPVNEKHEFWIILGGPIHTILTCLFGILIIWYRKSKGKIEFKPLDWLGVFLGLFILREVFNFITLSYDYIIKSKQGYTDETYLSLDLFNDHWSLPWISLILGLLILLYIIFRVIPVRFRFIFIVSGSIGGTLGFVIWFGFLGELLIP